MIELQKVGKCYGNKQVLYDVSFSIDKGNIVGLLGRNGAGKSTLMNIMTGYFPATVGEVLVDEMSIEKFPEKVKSKIGYLPEKPPVYEMMTVREFLTYVAKLKGMSSVAATEAVKQIVEKVGIGNVSNRLIRNLSKGYQQRVGIAQAMIGNPDILILDEPTVGLDPTQVVEFRQMLREYGKDHIIVVSSHILAEIAEICDRIIILNEGRLVKDCAVEELEAQNKGQILVSINASKECFEALMQQHLPECKYSYKESANIEIEDVFLDLTSVISSKEDV